MKTPWSTDELLAFELWHTQRLVELAYPVEIVKDLTADRLRWLSGVPVKKKGQC